jgi:hypothetical protein
LCLAKKPKFPEGKTERLNEGTCSTALVMCKNVATNPAAQKCRNLTDLRKDVQKREESKV